jgi:deferrochelatase/peroxidase EfeB
MSTGKSAEEQELTQRPPGEAAGRSGPSRRRLLTGAGLFGAGAVAGGLTGYFTRPATEPSGAGDTAQTIPFYGAHQAGIITPAQDRLAFRHHERGRRDLPRGPA